MDFFPHYDDIEKLRLTGEYDIVPVSGELLADFITPIEALRILKNTSEHCYLLESAQASEKWGRYTFLGFEPRLEITCLDGEFKAGEKRCQGLTQQRKSAKSWQNIAARDYRNCLRLLAVWSVTLPMISSATVSLRRKCM